MIPHGTNGRQFAHYVQNGLTPAATLLSATRWAAELMGWEGRVGSLAPSHYADLVVVDGDPQAEISTLERPSGVMKGGAWIVDPVSQAT